MLPVVWPCHAHGLASNLRCAPPALYHLFLLPAIAPSTFGASPRPIPRDPGADAAALPICRGGLCRYARTCASAADRTGGRESIDRDAVVKQHTARALLPRRKRRDRRQRELFGEETRRAFWQARFYDFNVWTVTKRVEKLRYMHRNPVKRGLVESPEQWRWSSYRFYRLEEPGPVQVRLGWGEISFRNRVA